MGGFEKDQMAEYEKMLFERNDDDWFVPDCSLDHIAEIEYRMYERECAEAGVMDA